MSVNRGKEFEDVIRECFSKVENVSVDRIHDQTTGYKGSTNICDIIAYRKPYIYYIECKSVHGNRLSISSTDPKHKYGNITNTQWEGLLEKSKIDGVVAGVICWWVDKDITLFMPIQELELQRNHGWKSIKYDIPRENGIIEILGKKKRVFFNYEMEDFLEKCQPKK